MTLIEILIVVAIITLVAGGVAVAALDAWEDARRKVTESNARAIRDAAKRWWLTGDTSICPGHDQLVTDKMLERGSPSRDAWGTPWQLECDGEDVTVSSAARDRRFGTSDDIRVPPG